MANYLLIESRDPFEARDVSYFYGLAADLAAQGDKVTLFLVQNGALASRKNARGESARHCLERQGRGPGGLLLA